MFGTLEVIWTTLFVAGLLSWLLGSVLSLDFHGRLRVIRSMFIRGALHGIEASFLADTSLRKLRTAILKVVWSRHQPLANVGAVLCLLDASGL